MPLEHSSIILVVDDNPMNIKVLFTCLKESGFKILVASNGEIALQITQDVCPDLILLDIMMPGMDGFEVCRRLKANPSTQEIPVIFMTALSEVENKIEGLALGAVDYITKPFHKEEILSRVYLHLKLCSLSYTLQQQNQRLKQEIEAKITAETELRQLTQHLEKRVVQRTSELSHALKNLQVREEQLSYAAFHDSLTNLPNRHWFMTHLSNLMEMQSSSSGKSSDLKPNSLLPTPQKIPQIYAILFIDLDRFKVINDSLGHLIGDELLQKVAERLKECLGNQGTLARLGGDEFTVLLENITVFEEAEWIAKRILTELQKPFNIKCYQIITGASIGIANSNMNYKDTMEILRDADLAMYHAKALGRGCYAILTPEMRAEALTRLELEHDLRLALEKEELCLYYQPILSLSDHLLVGFEALIRWNHPRKGLISPVEFIGIAEEIGIIQNLDYWALETACFQLQHWLEKFSYVSSLTMNVNLSACQIHQQDLPEMIESICRKTRLHPTCLKLEITEGCFMKTSSNEINILERIQSQGVGLCIDDFGTGYSSLSRLHSLPIHTLKIDRSFVHQMNLSTSGEAMVRTIINLAHNLGMTVVAEGIETQQQLEKLKILGCDFGQGYLFSRPLDAEKMNKFLDTYLPLLV